MHDTERIQMATITIDSKSEFETTFDYVFGELANGIRDEAENIKRFIRLCDSIGFPLTITKRERPDFVLESNQGKSLVGLEHTWAANPAWEEAETHMLKGKRPRIKMLNRGWVEGVKLQGKLLGQFIISQPTSSITWHPREEASAKAKEVQYAIERKSITANNSEFEKFGCNWLLITDKLPFYLLDLTLFEESLFSTDLTTNGIFSNIYFLTVLVDRKTRLQADALFKVGARRLERIG